MNGLTARQFMRGLPNEMQIKLLESDPVPTLEKMATFTQNMRAIERTTMPRPTQNVTSVSSPESREIAKLTALVEQLSTDQRELRAELTVNGRSAIRVVTNPISLPVILVVDVGILREIVVVTVVKLRASIASTRTSGKGLYRTFKLHSDGASMRSVRRPKNSRRNKRTKHVASCQELPIRSTIQVTIEGVQVRALIDTGSMKSFISSYVHAIVDFDNKRLKPDSISCVSITGNALNILGSFHTSVELNSRACFTAELLVSDNISYDCVLGWDFLFTHHLDLKGITLGDRWLCNRVGTNYTGNVTDRMPAWVW